MANSEIKRQSSERQNRFLLLLLLGATLLSAARDVVRLHDFASGVAGVANALHRTVNTAMASTEDPSCTDAVAENDNSAQPFYWNGRVAPEQLMKTSGSNGVVDAVPAVGLYLDVALGQASQPVAPIQVRAPAEVATAQPPSRHVGRQRSAKLPFAIALRNNLSQRSFTVRVASAVAFAEPAMDGVESPRVDAHFVNDQVSISRGYARTRVLNRAINTRLINTTCPQAMKFKTARRISPLELFQLLRSSIEADGLTGDTAPNPPRMLRVVIQRAVSAAAAEDTH